MNFDHLVYFKEVVVCHSITKAAEKLSRNPATITHAINQMEDMIGYRLLLRTPYGILPTEKGIEFYRDILEILKIQDQWKLQNVIHEQINDVAIATTSTVYNFIMPEIAYRAATNSEGIPINLIVSTIADMREFAEKITTKKLNIVILEGQPQSIFEFNLNVRHLNLQIEKIGTFINKVFFNSKNTLSAKQHVSLKEINAYKKCSTKDDFPAQMAYGIHSSVDEVTLTYSQNDLLHLLTNDRQYVAVLSELVELSPCFQSGLICSINFSDIIFPMDLYLLYLPETLLTPEELILVNLIRRFFKELFS